MTRSLDQLLEDQAAIALAIKAAQAAKVAPAIDTTRIVHGIDAAIMGLSAAVAALQGVKAMLTNTEQKAETAVAVHLPEANAEVATPTSVTILAPAGIEAAATAAEAPKKKPWWKKVLPYAAGIGLMAIPGGPVIKAVIETAMSQIPALSGATQLTGDLAQDGLVAGGAMLAIKAYNDYKAGKPKE